MSALLKPAGSIRPMTTHDLDSVLEVERRSYSFPWSRGNFIDSLAAGYDCQLLEQCTSGSVVGYLVAMAGVGEMHLLNLTVAPAWQGQGHGQRLIEWLLRRCREERLASLWLEVRASNQRARALYLRRGFAEVGTRRAYYPAALGTREDAVLMSLTVPNGAGDGVD